MPSPHNRQSVRAAIKRVGKTFARNALGLDVRRANRSLDNPILSGYGFKWISRFMHFERLLKELLKLRALSLSAEWAPEDRCLISP